MNLITVEVLCPSTSRKYDYKLPVKMCAADIKKQIAEDIRIFEGISELFENEAALSLYSANGCISDNATPEQAGVKNGDSIMLI